MAQTRRSRLIAPLLTLGLLAGVAVDTFSRPQPEDAEPYHQRVKQAEKDLPRIIGDWIGDDVPATESAIELLKPNVIYQRAYVNSKTSQRVNVLIVHCKDARDIYGHYPPVCYPAQGMEQRASRPMDWDVAGHRLTGMEYEFAGRGFSSRGIVVDNLILMSEGQVLRDMEEVGRTAWDYLKRFYGAAQLQVVFQDTEISDERRREIFRTMVRAHMPIVEAIIGDPK